MKNCLLPPIYHEIRHFHLFCGLGGGAAGFNKGHARVGSMHAKFRCIGGVDVDKACIRDFERLSGTLGTVLDLFDRDQYRAFHDAEPPEDWREATPDDIRRASGGEHPHIVFLSPPCKGYSGLLSPSKSKSTKYLALNHLTVRGLLLMLEAWAHDPVELIVLENVPRITSRGRHLLDQIIAVLRHYGYAVAETTHDCGELGNLAQSRKRYLLVARHIEKVPPFLYEPHKRPLRAVGDVLGCMLMPGDPAAGPMHRVPSLQWKTWVRLAFVEAGSDWRSLNKLAVENGFLRDYGIVPETAWRDDVLGVLRQQDTMGTITGKSGPTNGRYAVASPLPPHGTYAKYAVTSADAPSGTVISGSTTGQGAYAVADPGFDAVRHNNVYRVVAYGDTSGTVTGGGHPSSGGQAVADVRCNGWGREYTGHSQEGAYGVIDWGSNAGPVVAKGRWDNSRCAVASPLPGMGNRQRGDNYLTAGHYGVRRMDEHCGAISAAACHDNGFFSIADHRIPEARENLVCVIRALDGTWHRPFTTLELAALQGLVDPEEQLELDGLSDSNWRERIGNAVPPPAAQAIASMMGQTLLLAWSGETFSLGCTPIWVQPVAAALSLARGMICE